MAPLRTFRGLLWVSQVENEMAREVFVAAQPECERTFQ